MKISEKLLTCYSAVLTVSPINPVQGAGLSVLYGQKETFTLCYKSMTNMYRGIIKQYGGVIAGSCGQDLGVLTLSSNLTINNLLLLFKYLPES